MIAFLLALQIAGAAATAPIPTFVIIRDGATATSVPVTINGGEPSVRADALMRAMKGALVTGTNLHYALVLPRVRLDLIDGIPFAKLDTMTVALTRAPQVRGGQLYLPFQFVSEVIPRYVGGYFYDAAQGELRTFVLPIAATKTAPVRAPVVSKPSAAQSTSRPRSTVPTNKPAQRKVVVIDAGHGGPDNGMTGPIGTTPWFVEKDVTLSVATKLATVLRARGVDVLMTRTTDTLIALADRGKIANSNHGDVFISVHVNAPGYNTAAAARERGGRDAAARSAHAAAAVAAVRER